MANTATEHIKIILRPLCKLSFNVLLIGSRLNINAPMRFGKLPRIADIKITSL